LALVACGARSELSLPEAVPPVAKDCPAPEAIVLAREDQGFYNLALDETHVYWAADGAVRRVSKCGGTPETLVDNVPTVFDLDVSQGFVYFSLQHLEGAIARASVDGSATNTVFDAGGQPEGVRAAGGVVYASVIDSPTSGSRLVMAPAGGGMAIRRSPSVGRYFAIDESYAYAGGSGIVRLAHEGGAPEVLVLTASTLDLAVDATDLYWLDPSSRPDHSVVIRSAPKARLSGDGFELAQTSSSALRIAVDPLPPEAGGRVYWVNQDEGTVQSVPKRGGPVLTISDDAPVAEAIASDETSVYWLSYRLRTLNRRDAPPRSVGR